MSRATQWIALKRLGLSDTAAAVVMGHAMAESACEPNRVQGDSDPARTKSIVYTKWVDSGYVTRDEFIRNGPNGGGYGWLQWTAHDRKAGLYDLAKSWGCQSAAKNSRSSGFGWSYTRRGMRRC